MTYETKMKNSKYSGWYADTDAKISDVPATDFETAGERILRISTGKSPRGDLLTTASCLIIRKSERGYNTEQFAIGGDFRKTIHQTPCKRVTEKVTRETHAEALKLLPQVLEEAKAYYAGKEAA